MPEIKQDLRTATFIVAANDSVHKNMADYVCDGTSDEDEINAAIGTGRRVVLLEGTFTINAPITKAVGNVTLEGQGWGTVIALANASNCHVITVGGDNWTIKNLKIDANGDNQGAGDFHGIFSDSHDYGKMENVYIYNADYDGIRIHESDYWEFKGNKTELSGMNGIHCVESCHGRISGCLSIQDGIAGAQRHSIYIEGSSSIRCEDLVVSNCISIQAGYCAICVGNFIGVSIVNCYSTLNEDGTAFEFIGGTIASHTGTLTGCVVENTASDGARIIGADNCAIIGCTFYLTGRNGIKISNLGAYEVNGASIIGNTFYNIGKDHYTGIMLEAGTSTDITISGNTMIEDRAIPYFYVGISLLGTPSRIKIMGNTFQGLDGTGGWGGYAIIISEGGDDSIISNNLISNITAIGIHLDDGDDVVIEGNRIVGTPTPIDINNAAAARTVIRGNNWQGCTNNPSYAAATTPKFTDNIDIAGNLWLVDDNEVIKVVWVKHDVANPAICTVPAASFVSVDLFVSELFNAGTTNLLTIGYDADPDSVATFADPAIATTGRKTPVYGVEGGYMPTSRAIEAYYTYTGGAPATGEALIIFKVTRAAVR